MPSVSVIIPNYNHAPYLTQRIGSVLNQTYQDFEVIILDDKSTDNSRDIIEQYRNHPKVSHIIYNEENSGSTFKQWKKGIELAKGEWIWIAESDDWAMEDFLKKSINKILEDSEIVLTFTQSRVIDHFNKTLGITPPKELNNLKWWEEDYIHEGILDLKSIFAYRNLISNASAVLFRKETFLKIPFESYRNMRYAGDWWIWSSLAEYGKIAFIAQPLNNFRFHKNTTRSVKKAEDEIIRLTENMKVVNHVCRKTNAPYRYDFHKWMVDDWFRRMKQTEHTFFQKWNLRLPKKYLIKYASSVLKTKYREKTVQNKTTKTRTTVNKPITIPLPKDYSVLNWGKMQYHENEIPRKIFAYWNCAPLPEDKTKFLKNWQRFNPDYEIHLITDDNIQEYIPDFPISKDFPSPQYKSDLVRLSAIQRHGGFWVDTTTIFTESIEWLRTIQHKRKSEFIGFYNPSFMEEAGNPFIESWIFGAIPNAPFVTQWKNCFEQTVLSEKYFMYFKEKENYKQIKQKLSPGFEEYLIIHLAAQDVLLQSDRYALSLINAHEEALFYRYEDGKVIDGNTFAEYLLGMNMPEKISKIIKLTGGDRIALDRWLSNNNINTNSILKKFNIF